MLWVVSNDRRTWRAWAVVDRETEQPGLGSAFAWGQSRQVWPERLQDDGSLTVPCPGAHETGLPDHVCAAGGDVPGLDCSCGVYSGDHPYLLSGRGTLNVRLGPSRIPDSLLTEVELLGRVLTATPDPGGTLPVASIYRSTGVRVVRIVWWADAQRDAAVAIGERFRLLVQHLTFDGRTPLLDGAPLMTGLAGCS